MQSSARCTASASLAARLRRAPTGLACLQLRASLCALRSRQLLGGTLADAILRLPDRCDLVQERLILAAMGWQGRFIAHPAVVGYWVQHEGNESRRQYPDQDRQIKRMVEWLDDLMDEPGVADKAIDDFETWIQAMPTAHVMAWGTLLTEQGGRYAETMGEILLKELQGRVQEVREMPDAVVAGLRDMRLPEPALVP